MVRRNKLLIILTAIFLIPILLVMIPLNFFQKIGSGCPLTQGKQLLRCNPCPFNSLVSQDDLTIISLNSTPFKHELLSPLDSQVLGTDSLSSNISSKSLPLRC